MSQLQLIALQLSIAVLVFPECWSAGGGMLPSQLSVASALTAYTLERAIMCPPSERLSISIWHGLQNCD